MSASDDEELALRARSRIGLTLSGKYRLDALLGFGGMAAVYVGTHRNGRRVAIKLLHPELAARTDIRLRFVRESHAANAVEHPGVVSVVDDDTTEDGTVFLVMELLDGRTVEDLWRQNGHVLPVRTVLAIARELCDVLGAAHSAGIVHRDIKPANLFVTDDGRLKVLDFGIARVRDVASGKLTDTGTILGTPAFMAPEQASGRPSESDGRTDVWAVAATMFTLLSGRIVHEGETAQHIAILAATQAARSLAAVAPSIPTEVVRVVDRGLEREKAARWPSAEAMRDAIDDAARSLYGDSALVLDWSSATLPAARIPQELAAAKLPTTEAERPVAVGVSTTTQPVSSKAPTDPRERRPSVSARSIAKTAVALGARDEVVPGSPERRPLPEPRRSQGGPRRWIAGVGLLAFLVGGFVVASHVALTDVNRRSANEAPPTAGSATLPAPPSTTSASSQASSAPAASAPALGAHRPTVGGSARLADRPIPRPAPALRASPRPSASSAARPDCAQPYVIDETGVGRWRKECL